MTTGPAKKNRPLDGIRVVDFGQAIAMPYCGGLLADLGAEVIRIEAPMRVDPRRVNGAIAGSVQVLHRGKRSLALDLTKPEGIEIVKKLVAVSDIVIENFSGRVMRNFGLHFDELIKINPRIVMCSNSGYGSTGPWAPLPVQATALEGTLGLINYTGYPDLPSKVGGSYCDYLSAWTGLTFILAAFNHALATGKGQWIDQSMYQVGVMTQPEPILKIQYDGLDYQRIGNHDRWKSPSNVYRAKGDDEWIAVSVDSDEKWQRFAELMGRAELGNSEMFATVEARKRNEAHLDAVVQEWAVEQDRFAAMKLLQANGITAGAVQRASDLVFDEQMLERGFYEPIDYGDDGIRPIVGRPYKAKNMPVQIKWAAPEFADSNKWVLKEILNMSDEEIARLYELGAVSETPTGGRVRAANQPAGSSSQVAQAVVPANTASQGASPNTSPAPTISARGLRDNTPQRHDDKVDEKIRRYYGNRTPVHWIAPELRTD